MAAWVRSHHKVAYLAGAFILQSPPGGAVIGRPTARHAQRAIRWPSHAPADETSSQPWLRKSVSPSGRRRLRAVGGDFGIMPRLIARAGIAFGVVLALSACSDPYDPGQRALGGGAIGAGAGAAIGGLAGGWHGAAVGALAGGAIGAVGGAVTTPRPPPPAYYSPPPPADYQSQGYSPHY
jgi:hypothetical protein